MTNNITLAEIIQEAEKRGYTNGVLAERKRILRNIAEMFESKAKEYRNQPHLAYVFMHCSQLIFKELA